MLWLRRLLFFFCWLCLCCLCILACLRRPALLLYPPLLLCILPSLLWNLFARNKASSNTSAATSEITDTTTCDFIKLITGENILTSPFLILAIRLCLFASLALLLSISSISLFTIFLEASSRWFWAVLLYNILVVPTTFLSYVYSTFPITFSPSFIWTSLLYVIFCFALDIFAPLGRTTDDSLEKHIGEASVLKKLL